MKFFKKINQKLGNYLYDSSVYVKDRTFVLFTICELSALFVYTIIGMMIGEKVSASLVTLFAVIIGALILYYFVKKKKMHTAKIVLTLVLVCVLRPASFFTKGGIYYGTMIMFVIGAYYLVLVLEGRFRIFMCILDTVILSACCLIAYYHPEYLRSYDRRNDFI